MLKLWFGMPLLGLSLACPISNANTDAMALDTLVITDTRTERKLLDVPVRTEVISRESIEQSHARDLAEALRLHLLTARLGTTKTQTVDSVPSPLVREK